MAAERAGTAMTQLLPHTLDIVELAWTTSQGTLPASGPEARIRICGKSP
ncbi:hypothetical protein [Streptomyces sp. XH2]